jgi:hypothetical protein
MRPRKRNDKRQLRLNFRPVEHPVSGASKITDHVESEKINRFLRRSGMFHTAENLADQIQAEDRLRLLEPTSLPKNLRGWSPRPRPQTAIIARAAQRKYERRVTQDEVIGKFLGQHAAKLRRLAKRLAG